MGGGEGEEPEGRGRVELSAGLGFSHLSLPTMREDVWGESGSVGYPPSGSPSTLQGTQPGCAGLGLRRVSRTREMIGTLGANICLAGDVSSPV